MSTDLVFCPHCGGRNEPDAKFCGHCGRAMDDVSSAPAGAPGPTVPPGPTVTPGPAVAVTPQGRPARRSRLPLLFGLAGIAVIAVLAVFAFSAPAARWLGSVVHRAPAAPAAMPAARPGNFDVVLDAAGEQKIRVITAVREITGLSLAQTKTLVESAPVIIKTKVSQQDAEQIKQRLQGLDAAVRVVPAGTFARSAPVPQPSTPASPAPTGSAPPGPPAGLPIFPVAPAAPAPAGTPPAPPLGSPATPAPRAQLVVDNFNLTSITPRTGTDGLNLDVRGSFRVAGATAPVPGQIVPAWRKGAGALHYGTPAPLVARNGAVPVSGSVFVPRPLPSDSVQVFLAVRFGGREWLSSPGSVALTTQAAAPPAPPRAPVPPQAAATPQPAAPPQAPAAPPAATPPSGQKPAAAVRLKLTATSPTQVAAGAKVSFNLSYVSALDQRAKADYTLAWRTPDGTLHYGNYGSMTAAPGTNSVRGLGLTIGTSSSGTTLPVYGVVRIDGTVYRTQIPVLVNVASATRAAPAPSTPSLPPSQLSTVARLTLLPNGPIAGVAPGTVIPLTFSFDLVNLDAADVEAALAWRVGTGPLNVGQYTTLHAKRGPNSVKGTFTAANMPSGTEVSVHVVVRYAGTTYTSNPVPVTIR